MTPLHSIDFCPICGGGLCGIRIIGAPVFETTTSGDPDDSAHQSAGSDPATSSLMKPHGLVICDECEAIWLEPDVSTVHQYTDLENAVSPVNGQPIWGDNSRWASMQDIESLGWTEAVNPELDAEIESEMDGDEKIV